MQARWSFTKTIDSLIPTSFKHIIPFCRLSVITGKIIVYVIVVPWLLKCVGFVPPKGYHVLPRAKLEEVHDKPEGGAIPHTSKAMVQLTCTIAVYKV